MKGYVIKYGIIASVILLVFGSIGFALVEYVGYGLGEIFGFASMFLSFAMIFIAVRSYRNKELGGKISFGKAFMMGIYISLIVTAVYVAGWMMYYNPDTSDFMETYKQQTVEKMKDAGQSQENIDRLIANMDQQAESYNSSAMYRAGMTAMEIFPVGILFSLVSAGVLFKREN